MKVKLFSNTPLHFKNCVMLMKLRRDQPAYKSHKIRCQKYKFDIKDPGFIDTLHLKVLKFYDIIYIYTHVP